MLLFFASTVLLASPVFGALSIHHLPEKYHEIAFPFRDTCLHDLGLTMDDHANFEFNGDRNTMISEEGVIQYDQISDFIDAMASQETKEHMSVHENNCPLEPEGADTCEKGYNFLDCIKKNMGDGFLFP